MKGYRKILIAVNGSMDVLKKGIDLASDEGCWVTVLKVIPPYEGELELTGVKNISDVLNSGSDEITESLKDFFNDNKTLAKVRIEEGDIPDTIKKIAREERCDVVVMGARKKKNFFQKLISKNIVSGVLENSPCPVLFVDA